MNHLYRFCRSFLPTLGLAAFLAGCAVHARVYDPYYHDYHHWDDAEVGYYSQWERGTHREHRDFKDRDDKDKERVPGMGVTAMITIMTTTIGRTLSNRTVSP